jgi:hypothetical protein
MTGNAVSAVIDASKDARKTLVTALFINVPSQRRALV